MTNSDTACDIMKSPHSQQYLRIANLQKFNHDHATNFFCDDFHKKQILLPDSSFKLEASITLASCKL